MTRHLLAIERYSAAAFNGFAALTTFAVAHSSASSSILGFTHGPCHRALFLTNAGTEVPLILPMMCLFPDHPFVRLICAPRVGWKPALPGEFNLVIR